MPLSIGREWWSDCILDTQLEALHEAARVRRDDTCKFLCEEGATCDSVKNGSYHRSCCQNYTNNTNLTRLQKSAVNQQ